MPRPTHTSHVIKERLPLLMTLGGEEAEIEIDVKLRLYPGCPDWYDPSIGGPGGWMPGDPPEAELLEATGPNDEPLPTWLFTLLSNMDWHEIAVALELGGEPDDDERPDEPSPEEMRRMKALYDAEKAAGLHRSRAEHEADLIAAGRGHLIRRE